MYRRNHNFSEKFGKCRDICRMEPDSGYDDGAADLIVADW
jgi:hypothetical protein